MTEARPRTSPTDYLLMQIAASGLPEPTREYRFCERLWRVDLAWPDRKLAVEMEGGVWIGGRHTSPVGFLKDLEKYNRLSLEGWTLLRCTPAMCRDGTALGLLTRALGG